MRGANSNRLILHVLPSAGAKAEIYTANLDGTDLIKVSGTPPVGSIASPIPSWW